VRLLTAAALTALLLSQAACAGVTAPQPASPTTPRAPSAAAPQPPSSATSAPADPAAAAALQKLFERELEPLPPLAFRTPKGVRGKVEAKSAPEVKADEGVEVLSIPIGTEQPVVCTIFEDRIDAAGTIWQATQGFAESVEILQLRPAEVVAVAGNAILFTQAVYRVKTDKGWMAGLVELAVHPHETHSLLCVHDEPGYSATFRRIVKGLAGSMTSDHEDTRAKGRFAEVLAIRIASMAVGYSERVIWPREDGGRTSITWNAQVLPRSPTEIVAIDSVQREESDARGLLLSATHVRVQNGEVESSFTVTRGEDGKTFRYQGEKAGKKLEGTFQSKAGLATELWFARKFDAKRGFGPKAEVRHQAWSSGSNPTTATPIACRKDPAGARRARMTLGPISLAGELDDHGLFRTAEMPIGPATLVLDRLWTRGAP
jgi:hypothetical protein